MADSLRNLIQSRRGDEPPEFGVIRQFLRQNYQAECQLALSAHQIVIIVNSAALAGSLRLKLHELQKSCGTDRRLVIRIG